MDSEDIAATFLQNLASLLEERKIDEIKKVVKTLAKIDQKSLRYFLNRIFFKNQVIQASLFQRSIEKNFIECVSFLLQYGGDFNSFVYSSNQCCIELAFDKELTIPECPEAVLMFICHDELSFSDLLNHWRRFPSKKKSALVELFCKHRPDPIFLWQFLITFETFDSIYILMDTLEIHKIKEFERRDNTNLLCSIISEYPPGIAEKYIKKLISMQYFTIDPPSKNALFRCIVPNLLPIAKILIEKGTDVNSTENGKTILHFVKDTQVAKFYLDNGFNNVRTGEGIDPLIYVLFRNEEVFERVYKLGCDIDFFHPTKGTILHHLIVECYWYPDQLPVLLRIVLKYSTKHINTKFVNQEPLTTYFRISKSRNPDVVKLLIDHGAKLYPSFLDSAIIHQELTIAEILMNKGIFPGIIENANESLIHRVFKNGGNLQMIRAIWRKGGCSLRLLCYGTPNTLQLITRESVSEVIMRSIVFYAIWDYLRLILLAIKDPPHGQAIINADIWKNILQVFISEVRVVTRANVESYLKSFKTLKTNM